jgi:hypothetical protein
MGSVIPAQPHIPLTIPKPTKALLMKGPVSTNKGKSKADAMLKEANECIVVLKPYISEKLYPRFSSIHLQLSATVKTVWAYLHAQGAGNADLSLKIANSQALSGISPFYLRRRN